MSDPRYTDPRTTDPRLNDPVLRQDEPGSAMWGWVAGLAVLALIAFVVVAGWNSNTASNNSPPPITTGANTPANAPNTPMRNVTPPASTTGSGATSPQPAPPAPTQSPNGGR
jgi:hypothetical protein